MLDFSDLNKFDIVLTINTNLHEDDMKWIPRIFLELDGNYVKFTDLEIPKDYVILHKFDKELAYEPYREEKIPRLPKENDIVYASDCDYMFNPMLNRKYWVIRKFVRTDDNKFITRDNDNKEQKWDFIIPYYDNYKENMDLDRALSCNYNHLSYASINRDE